MNIWLFLLYIVLAILVKLHLKISFCLGGMKMKFKSSIGDGAFLGLVVYSLFTLAMFIFWVVSGVWWPAIVLTAIMCVVILPIYFGTSYSLERDELRICCGPFEKTIQYRSIVSATDADGLGLGFALSHKRICIRYLVGENVKMTYISPVDRNVFRDNLNTSMQKSIATLKSRGNLESIEKIEAAKERLASEHSRTRAEERAIELAQQQEKERAQMDIAREIKKLDDIIEGNLDPEEVVLSQKQEDTLYASRQAERKLLAKVRKLKAKKDKEEAKILLAEKSKINEEKIKENENKEKNIEKIEKTKPEKIKKEKTEKVKKEKTKSNKIARDSVVEEPESAEAKVARQRAENKAMLEKAFRGENYLPQEDNANDKNSKKSDKKAKKSELKAEASKAKKEAKAQKESKKEAELKAKIEAKAQKTSKKQEKSKEKATKPTKADKKEAKNKIKEIVKQTKQQEKAEAKSAKDKKSK